MFDFSRVPSNLSESETYGTGSTGMAHSPRAAASSAGCVASLVALALLALAPGVRADCAFTEDCINSSGPDCRPKAVPNGTKPGPLIPPVFNVCPQYGNEQCCSVDQREQLFINFKLIDSAFGKPESGGCPACAANLKGFWCAFTCHPNQTAFIDVLPDISKVDPLDPNNPNYPYTVFHPVVHFAPGYACDSYAPCPKTGKVAEVASLSTCEGFYNYQGQIEGIGQGHTFIDFVFNSSRPGALSQGVSSCCNYNGTYDAKGDWIPYNPPGVPNSSCPCSTCAGMCAGGRCPGAGSAFPGLGDSHDQPLNGINVVFLVAMYSVTLLLSVTVVFSRRCGFCGGVAVQPESPRTWHMWGASGSSDLELRGPGAAVHRPGSRKGSGAAALLAEGLPSY